MGSWSLQWRDLGSNPRNGMQAASPYFPIIFLTLSDESNVTSNAANENVQIKCKNHATKVITQVANVGRDLAIVTESVAIVSNGASKVTFYSRKRFLHLRSLSFNQN